MTNRPRNRITIALALGFITVLVQFSAFIAIASNGWNELTSSPSNGLKIPFPRFAQSLGGELVYPVFNARFVRAGFGAARTGFLRAVEPEMGRVREIHNIAADLKFGLVSDGQHLWIIGNDHVFETDGRDTVEYSPKRTIGRGKFDPFMYDDMPAVIDADADGHIHLLTLADGEWIETGTIALPGEGRSWTVDEHSGQSILVPRTSANPTDQVTDYDYTLVVPSNGKTYLFQGGKTSVCYRVGFDVLASPEDADCASAMAPVNEAADTTGWMLLNSEIVSKLNTRSWTVFRGDLYAYKDQAIWRLPLSEGLTESTRIERVATIEDDSTEFVKLVVSLQSDTLYAVAHSGLLDADVFQIVDGELHQMPYHLEGVFEPFRRLVAKTLLQGLAVTCLSTAALILISGWMTGRTIYSFGRDSVLLAPVVRRSLARCVDLILVFGPLAWHLISLMSNADGASIQRAISNSNTQSLWLATYPGEIWAFVTWSLLVISTGIWGQTPGKWLFGVRVIRTSLRRCGIFAALLRELLMFLDTPQLLTALPGLVCYLATENGQRIGDLAAGTVVVDTRTVLNVVP